MLLYMKWKYKILIFIILCESCKVLDVAAVKSKWIKIESVNKRISIYLSTIIVVSYCNFAVTLIGRRLSISTIKDLLENEI